MTGPVEAVQLLDSQMDHVAGPLMDIPIRWFQRILIPAPAETAPE